MEPTARIRVASPTDLDVMFDIRTSVRENHLSLNVLNSLGITLDTLLGMVSGVGRGWIAEQDGQGVAFTIANSRESIVLALFVRPEHEGKGLGRQLLHHAERWLFAQGCETIWLSTDADRSIRANGFYHYLGWQIDPDCKRDAQVKFIKRCPVREKI